MSLKFLTFDLNPERRELRQEGALVGVPPKSFDVLCYLIDHRDRMVTKAELLDQFWSEQVSEAALQKAISLLRKATHCDGESVVRTYHGLGFRFVPELLDNSLDDQSGSEEPTKTLQERRLVGVICLQFGAETTPVDTVVEEFLERSGTIVAAEQGEAIRMTVEGFTASFGLSTLHEDAARRAVHCAVAMVAAAKEQGEIDVKIGIDHGPVDLSDKEENTKWRRPSEIERGAVQMANIGNTNEIILSTTTQHQLRDEITCAAVESGFRLIDINVVQAGVPGRPQKNPAQFVGRGAEMAFLDKSLEALGQGYGQGVVLSGPAGIGKTRLLSEFLSGLDTGIYNPVKVQCSPGLINSPLAPIRELCQMLFTKAPAGTIQNDVDDALHAELLGGASEHAKTLATLSEYQLKQQSYALLNRMLKTYCLETPLVLAFEDIHWLDVTSRDCLDAIIQQSDGMRLLVIMTTRPSDDPSPSETIVQLSPLGHQDGLKLLHDNINETTINDKMADDLVRRAAGNPFFIEELALALQSGDDPARELPETVHAVISVRIGALDPTARAFLFVIAVIGPAAQRELVAHLLDQKTDQIKGIAERLRLMGFVQSELETYSFRHMLISDTAYAMLASKERRKLHREIAAYLETDALNWEPRPETLAWHNQEAGDAEKATLYWLKACRAAMQRLAHREGIVFAENGLALFAQNEINEAKRELDLQVYMASALAAIYGYAAENVGEAYHKARRMNETVGDPRAQVRIIVGLWINAWVGGDLSKSLDYGQDLLNVAKVAHDPSLSLQAHASMGQVLMHKGRLKEALVHLTSGLDAIAETPPTSPPAQTASVACASFASWTNCLMGNSSEAKRILEVSKTLSHIRNNPLAEAVHYGLCVQPFMLWGRVDDCLDYADRGVSVSRTHDFAFWLGTGLLMRGWALGQKGKMDRAFEDFDEGLSVFEGTGAGVQLAHWYSLKAETLLTAGRFTEGMEAADYSLYCAAKTGDMHSAPRSHVVTARLWIELNEPEKAAYHSQVATEKATEFGYDESVITLLI